MENSCNKNSVEPQVGKYSYIYIFSLASFFLVAMQYYQDNLGGHGLSLPTNSACWITFSFVIAAGAWKWFKTGKLYYCQMDIVLVVVAIGLLLPLMWSPSPWRELSYDRYIAIFALLMFILSYRQFSFDRSQKQFLWAIIVLGIVIQCLIGIVQFFMADQIYLVSDSNPRPLGTTQQVNVYASLIATAFVISIYQLLSEKLNIKFKLLHLLMIFLAGVLQTLVLSRTGIAGLVIAFLVLSALFFYRWKQLLILLVVFSLGVSAALFMQSQNEVEGRKNLSDPGYRKIIYQTSIDLIKERPILGHGMGSFSSHYHNKQADFYANHPEIIPKHVTSVRFPHNELLYWWSEGGLLTVLLLAFFVFHYTYSVWKRGEIEHQTVWILLIPIALHTQTEFPLYHSVASLTLLGFLIAVGTPGEKRFISPSFSILPFTFATLMPIGVTVFMLTNLHASWLLSRYWVTGDSSYLFNKTNPFGQQSAINFYKATVYYLSDEKNLLPMAENILSNDVKLRPSHLVYWTLYNVQLKLGEVEKAEITYNTAQYLYPASDKFIPRRN